MLSTSDSFVLLFLVLSTAAWHIINKCAFTFFPTPDSIVLKVFASTTRANAKAFTPGKHDVADFAAFGS